MPVQTIFFVSTSLLVAVVIRLCTKITQRQLAEFNMLMHNEQQIKMTPKQIKERCMQLLTIRKEIAAQHPEWDTRKVDIEAQVRWNADRH